jgi:hypothetical protein
MYDHSADPKAGQSAAGEEPRLALDAVHLDQPPDQPGAMELAGTSATVTQPAAQIQRPARALIGWMATADALRILNGSAADRPGTDEQRSAVEAAQRRVTEREAVATVMEPTSDRPAELEAYMTVLRADPAAAQMLASGWDVAMVDLTRVIAFQPQVFTDSAFDRIAGIDSSSVEDIARITLPVQPPASLPIQFDTARKCWHVVSRNPNLQAVAPWAGPVATPQGLVIVIGFVLSIPTSFLQVAEFGGRRYLRDGYHRAYALLSAGIAMVPAFVRRIDTIEELVPPGMLPQAAYQGPTPPFLADYLDDTVAASALLPAQQKLVAIQALELSPIV